MDLKKKTLLVISPHPDDETLGCGGLIAKVKALGGKAYVIVFALGNIAQYGGKSDADARLKELEAAMDALGVDAYDMVYVDDAKHLKLDALPRKELVDAIERGSTCAITKVTPDIIAIPSPASTNQDHTAVFEAARTACRPRNSVLGAADVLIYEQTDILWGRSHFKPNVFIDITGQLDTKLKALACYGSQMREDPDMRSVANVERLARLRGSQVCVGAGEAFEALRVKG